MEPPMSSGFPFQDKPTWITWAFNTSVPCSPCRRYRGRVVWPAVFAAALGPLLRWWWWLLPGEGETQHPFGPYIVNTCKHILFAHTNSTHTHVYIISYISKSSQCIRLLRSCSTLVVRIQWLMVFLLGFNGSWCSCWNVHSYRSLNSELKQLNGNMVFLLELTILLFYFDPPFIPFAKYPCDIIWPYGFVWKQGSVPKLLWVIVIFPTF